MEFPPVRTKTDFCRRYLLGEFGNHSPSWDTYEEFLKEWIDFNGYLVADYKEDPRLYHLRNRVAGGITHYNLQWPVAASRWWEQEHKDSWYCSEMCPTAKTILQGEVMETERGLYLYSSTLALPMRLALSLGEHSYGIIAVTLLRQHFCANSYEWLMTLLERYPGHVVEFTTLSTNWGTVPHYNTVFWEVRNY